MKYLIVLLYLIALSPLPFVVITLVPHAASKINKLGYYSTCPFAPWSSVILVGISAILFLIPLAIHRITLG